MFYRNTLRPVPLKKNHLSSTCMQDPAEVFSY